MEPVEKETFEATLLQDDELAEEVEAYKEISALADSIEQKVTEAAQPSSEKAIPDNETWELLEQERKYWEEYHEPEFKHVHNLSELNGTNIAGEELRGKVISINRKKWLAAAVVIGIIGSASLLWWYVQPAKKIMIAVMIVFFISCKRFAGLRFPNDICGFVLPVPSGRIHLI